MIYKLNISKRATLLNSVALFILGFFVIFLKLDCFHMRLWDESMFAVNTYEMLHNNKYFSFYYEGHPDLINTKPPIIVWLQLLFVKLIGYNELAIRLPSAIATAISVLVTFLFIEKRYGLILAWLSALILLTSQGFITFHTARGGEADSLLTLFTLIANIYFLKYISESNRRAVFYFLLFLTLAFCTKLYAALLFIPAYMVILILQKKIKDFTLNRFFILGVLFFIGVAFGLLYLRELDTPGYLKEIFFVDANRVFKSIGNHKHAWSFYLDNLTSERFTFWFIPMVIGIILILFKKDESDNLIRNFLLLAASCLLIISVSQTKLHWYDMQLYPYMSVVAAWGVFHLLGSIFESAISIKYIVFSFVILFSYPYWIQFRNSQDNSLPFSHNVTELNERYLFSKSLHKENIDGLKVYYYRWNGSLLFYKYKFAEAGQNIELITNPVFSLNDRVLLSDDSLYSIIKEKYQFDVLEESKPLRVLLIK